MTKLQAKDLIIQTFENPFDKNNFIKFISNLLKTYDRTKVINIRTGVQGVTTPYLDFISSWERIGRCVDSDNNIIDILIIKLNKESSLYRARTAQRNFVANYLQGKLGTKSLKDAALVAFVSPGEEDWRFSLVKMEYRYKETPSRRIKIEEEFTPAKRWSFLVGKNEKSHTAQSRFIELIENENFRPNLKDLENAFDVEVVTKEFFEKYRDLFVSTKLKLDEIVERDPKLKEEFKNKNINTVDFTKKLLGQIVFLYFLQKKGWFGVEKGQKWGTGHKDFMRRLFNKEFRNYKNFFNDILEPLFYEALRTDRSHDDHFHQYFNCKIPFLNGGLFDPINDYDWVNTEIVIPDEVFSNENKNGILDIFDLYNFTVNEEEPLEKEVALDPELLGKIYEKLNAIREDNFDEYVQVIKSGKKGEESKFNKEYGVYYTPREIVHYMCKESLINYLETELTEKVEKEDIEKFVRFADLIQESERTAFENKKRIERGEQKGTKFEHKMPISIIENAKVIDKLLDSVKICDPAVGSGAFPVGMLHEIVKLRKLLSNYTGHRLTTYELKKHTIENSLYGVDIDAGAVEICKLRFWLSLIVDEEDFQNIKPLPNLDYKIVCGNSLLSVERDFFNSDVLSKIEKLKPKYFNETNPTKKHELKKQIDELIFQITNRHKEFDFQIYFSEVFHEKKGFDIAIANPPYVSTKGVKENDKKILEKYFGFADDLYNHFYFKGVDLLKEKGILTYISSKTFWTIQTKKNLRQLLLKNKLLLLVDTANPFESAMVDTCIATVKKQEASNYLINFIDLRYGWEDKKIYTVKDEVYKNVVNNVFFIPTDFNLKVYQKLGKPVKKLIEQWWNRISTSKNIEKYKRELEEYRKSLKPGDITLLGLITEGGQGLATANNGKYIGVLEGTRWAEKVRKERPEKLWDFACSRKVKVLSHIKTKQEAIDFLNSLPEKDIRELFDELKEKYGRDIFGQGWLYRIVSPDEIADVDQLTEDEKLNGIKGKRTFVPYDKGDKEGNRWWAPTPYYIDWSRENVKFLKDNSGRKGEGMPVVRNQQYYFREGFCWNNVLSDEKIKCRLKDKTIHSTEAMTFISLIPEKASDRFLICLLNSNFFGNYRIDFINVSNHLTTGDAKEFPIIIPTSEQLKEFKDIFDRAVKIQKQKFSGKISVQEAEINLEEIQKELDKKVLELYGL